MNALRTVRFLLPTLLIVLVSCAPQTNVEEVKKAVEEADARQLNAFQTKDIAGLTANYAPDAVLLPPHSPMVTGAEGREAFFKEMAAMVIEFKFGMTSFDASGDLAYEIGTYSGQMDIPGMGPVSDTGKYLSVWKRQADGKWMIVADIYNTDMPMAAPAADQEKKK